MTFDWSIARYRLRILKSFKHLSLNIIYLTRISWNLPPWSKVSYLNKYQYFTQTTHIQYVLYAPLTEFLKYSIKISFLLGKEKYQSLLAKQGSLPIKEMKQNISQCCHTGFHKKSVKRLAAADTKIGIGHFHLSHTYLCNLHFKRPFYLNTSKHLTDNKFVNQNLPTYYIPGTWKETEAWCD